MLTVDKIIYKLTKANNDRFIFKCIGKDEDFVKTYTDFKKYQLSLRNMKNGGDRFVSWNEELHRRYNRFIKNCWFKKII